MKDGKFIDHTEAILRIESVKKEDKGMYQCVIKNDQESAQSTAELKLGGRCKTISDSLLETLLNFSQFSI